MSVHSDPTPDVPADARSRTRRAVLAAGLSGVAAWVAGAFVRPEPAEAAVGGTAKLGRSNTAGSSTTRVTSGGTSSALFGDQTGTGFGVRGESTAGTGVLGTAKAANRIGVRGRNTATTHGGGAGVTAEGGKNHGLIASTANESADAIQATNSAPSSLTGVAIRATAVANKAILASTATGVVAIEGTSSSPTGVGVLGSGTGASGIGVQGSGVIGVSSIGTLTVAGNAQVSGVVSAAAIVAGVKSFRIDHPLDPANRYLTHACVESDERRNVYDGTVELDADGTARVALPAWFEALNGDVRYQLTAIGAAMPNLHVARAVKEGAFGIAGGKPGGSVCWQLTGVRRDKYAMANPIAVDMPKRGRERGRYLHPEAFGADPAQGIDALAIPGASTR